MTDRTNPVVARYLSRFESGLARVPEPERGEMVRELESHIAEATHAGTDLARVLESLGPADRLAEAYRVELTLKKSGSPGGGWMRFFAVAGILATTSLPTFVIVVALGAIGIGCLFGGLAAVIAGPLALVLPDSMIHLSAPFPTPFAELSAVLVGLVLIVLGIGAFGLLYAYLRLLVRGLRSLLPEARAAIA